MRRAMTVLRVWMLGVCMLPGVGAEETARLPEIVVTPTRTDQPSQELPCATTSIGHGDIQSRKLARTTPDALDETAGIMLQKTGHAQGSPYMRGFTGFRTLFLVDGIRLNNSTFRDGPNQYWNTVDPYSIDRLEAVKGPGSVLYGSDAVGGTVNALTASPFDLPEDRDWTGRALYRYSTAEDSHTVRTEGRAASDDKLGLQAGATYKDYGDLRAGDGTGRQEKTGYDETDYDAKAEYRFSPDLRLTVAHQGVTQNDAWRTHRTIHGESFHGTSVGKEKKLVLDQERYLTYAAFEADSLPGFVEQASLTLSHHRQEEEQFRVRTNDTSDLQGVKVDTLGAALELVSPSALGDWVYGIEYYRDSVDSYSRSYNADGSLKSTGIQGPVADDAAYDNLGAYLQDTLALDDRWDVILGGRYNYLAADADAFADPVSGEQRSLSESWDAVVGSARALYRLLPDAGLNLFAGVSQGFRAPNLSDLTRLDTARTAELETPSPDVDPEYFTAYEAGLKLAAQNLTAEAAYFYTDIRDMIVRAPTGRTIGETFEVTKKNAGDGYIHGAELSASLAFLDDWLAWGNIAWMEGEVDTYPTSSPEKHREPIDRLMPLAGNLGLRFTPGDRYWLEAVMSAADKADKLSSADQADTQRIPPGGTPGYAVFSLRGGCQPAKDIKLTAAIENIADKDYRIHGSGINEPGRNLVVAAEYAF